MDEAPVSLKAGDLDGDGKPDLAVASYGGDSVSVLLNQGSGTFAAPVRYAVGNAPLGLTTADLNGDGKLDLAVASEYSESFHVLINDGSGSFSVTELPAARGARGRSWQGT